MDRMTCFVASPIGQDGSDARTRADDVYDFLIEPALDRYNFNVTRADRSNRGTDIRDDMVTSLRESDLCVVVMTDMNPNVMFEFGIRFETGRPFVVLMDEAQRKSVPFDTRTLRIIFYDGSFQNPRATRDSQLAIQRAVDGFIEEGIGRTTKASFESIADSLNRVERKLDSILRREPRESSFAPDLPPSLPTDRPGRVGRIPDPLETFGAAFLQGDVARMERLLPLIESRVDFVTFYDNFVEGAAALGSEYAGRLLSQNMERFMLEAPNAKAKVEYLGCLVSYCMRRGKEGEELEHVVSVVDEVLENPDLTNEQRGVLHCQVSRMLYGQYMHTDDETLLYQSINALERAISCNPQDASYYFNMAMCKRELGKLDEAEEEIMRCLELEKNDDADHLALACRIFARTNNPELETSLERLHGMSPDKYEVICAEIALERFSLQ